MLNYPKFRDRNTERLVIFHILDSLSFFYSVK